MTNENETNKPENTADGDACAVDALVMPDAHDNATTLYCIPMMIESQKKPLDDHCFGDCGKISMGGVITIDEVGPCWVCTHGECPHEKGHTETIGSSQMTGEPVRIRGLGA